MKRLVLCAALLAFSGLASAVVYKWTDAQGKVQYGDRPPDGVHAEVVELLGTHTGRSARAEAAPTPNSKGAATAIPGEAGPKDDKKTVADDVSQARDKQCADAQARYKTLIDGRRLYKTGTDGERQYLTSDEIDSERLNAKRDVDQICNSPT